MNDILRRRIRAASIAIIAALIGSADASSLNLPVKTINGRRYYYHVVQPKETIYSLSRQLGVERADIIKHNPSVVDGLRVNETIYFPADEFESTETETATDHNAPLPASTTHIVQKGETAYGIAHRYGCTVDELVAANPHIRDGVKNGETIRIPSTTEAVQIEETYPTETAIAPATAPTAAAHEDPIPQVEPPMPTAEALLPDTIATEDNAPGEINIAVMLPFQLERERPTKQALHYTDFYRGLLMAVDTMRTCGTPIHIYAYDTCDSPDTISAILAGRPEMATIDMIVAPNDSAHIELLAQHADSIDATVVNMFAVRNEAHLRHSSVMQGNIPHHLMYDKAITGFLNKYEGFTPVILNQAGENDKASFIDALTSRLDSAGIDYRTVNYTGTLDDNDLAWMGQGVRYVFIPSSSTRASLNSFINPLINKRGSAELPDDIQLFGYPEWIILRGDLQKKLHEVNTSIYSRFVMDSDNYRTRRLESRFREWYGASMIPTAPMQGTLGYDTGMWMITTAMGEAPEYQGLQNGFNVEAASDGDAGWMNKAMYLIHFLPSGTIERTVL